MLQRRPQVLQISLQPAAQPDGVMLVATRIIVIYFSDRLDTLKVIAVATAITPQHEQDAAIESARSPQPVVIVRTNGVWQAVPWSVEVDRYSLAPAIREDSRAGAVCRRQAVVGARHLLHHLLPSEFIGKILR